MLLLICANILRVIDHCHYVCCVGFHNPLLQSIVLFISVIYRIFRCARSPGEMSRLRLTAAVSWLKLARSQVYLENIELTWYQSMTYTICVSQ